MGYMLDTNICIEVIRKRNPKLISKISSIASGEIYLSTIVLAELQFGAAKSADPAKNNRAIIKFCAPFTILPFDNDAAAAYGYVRFGQESKGTPIGPMDTLIASHALSLDLTLVTNNMREFKRINGLKLENWVRKA